MQLDTLDFNKKILHASWHPRENTIAVCVFRSELLARRNAHSQTPRSPPRTTSSCTVPHNKSVVNNIALSPATLLTPKPPALHASHTDPARTRPSDVDEPVPQSHPPFLLVSFRSAMSLSPLITSRTNPACTFHSSPKSILPSSTFNCFCLAYACHRLPSPYLASSLCRYILPFPLSQRRDPLRFYFDHVPSLGYGPCFNGTLDGLFIFCHDSFIIFDILFRGIDLGCRADGGKKGCERCVTFRCVKRPVLIPESTPMLRRRKRKQIRSH